MKFASSSLLTLSLLLIVSVAVAADQAKVDKERQEIRKRNQEILAQLYKVQPNAKTAVQKAAGIATFSNFGMKIFVAGSGTGRAWRSTTRPRKKS